MSDNLQEEKQADYKSCFARSVAVSSQYSNSKTADTDEVNEEKCQENLGTFSRYRPEYTTLLRIKKNPRRTCLEDGRRYSCGATTTIRQNPLYAQRISEIPIENMVHQNKIETLQWQLKEVEKSREMYRAVMKQVVTFLEKAHQSLEIQKTNTVPRSKSEHHITSSNISSSSCRDKEVEESSQINFSWNVTKKEKYINEKVIPPDKLSQEAFRLLRMTQSLLETNEPKLCQGPYESSDSEFLAQLAKEFPATPEHWPKRSTSFTHSSKVTYSIESDLRISTAFNRKLSLQLAEVRRKSSNSNNSKGPNSEEENKDEKFNSHQETADSINLESREKNKLKASPSVSSAEDESGFSSLTSFQEIGLPLLNSTTTEEVSPRNALLKSMLHSNSTNSSTLENSKSESLTNSTTEALLSDNGGSLNGDNFWSSSSSQRKRSLSTPVHNKCSPKPNAKVLWV